MYEPLLPHARHSTENLIAKLYLEKQIRALKPPKSGIKTLFLLKMSDLFLAVGERIRPEEIQVYNSVNQFCTRKGLQWKVKRSQY